MVALNSPETIGFDAGSRALAAGVAHATELGLSVCLAVVDRAGHLVVYCRMDGAPLVCATLAQDKAWTVAAFGAATHEVWDSIKDQPPVVHGLPKTERVIVFAGGVPITSGGETVGAVGVSGGTADQDRIVAEAAAAAALA